MDSRPDTRVRTAGFLAGITREIVPDELNGRGDAALTALLRPYAGAEPVRGDERSWSRLSPGTTRPGAAAEINSGV
ncbi:hypothetical protein [Streptomyces sp. NPDC058964]|uniref:hypothetical protein n=1 Tax=Streptomyces sp. NPDC058964 TaxID=3346681 RepID=UPI0036C41C87